MTGIILRRSGALGDVVLATPVLRRLRRENPDAHIYVETGYRDVFKNNPHVTIVNFNRPPGARVIDLDLAYERRPTIHIVEAYMMEAFGDPGDPLDRQQEMFASVESYLALWNDHKTVAVHAATAGWKNRTLPRETWARVTIGLYSAGLHPVLIGTPRDDVPTASSYVPRLFSPDLGFVHNLITQSAAFVGSDSGLLHVAGTTNTPIVGVFTCASPEYRLPWRDGVLGGNCTTVVPDIDCVGCMRFRLPPVTTEWCQYGNAPCVSKVRAEEIVEAVLAAVKART